MNSGCGCESGGSNSIADIGCEFASTPIEVETMQNFAVYACAAAAGESWTFQMWYRDPASGSWGCNLSSGLEITFGA